MRETCETCRWSSFPFPYVYCDQHDTLPTGYKCQRRAPVATGGMMSPAWTAWPRVAADDWCGEHQTKEAGDAR